MNVGRDVCCLMALALFAGCAGNPDKRTIAELREVDPDMQEVVVDDSLTKALDSYRRFLDETPRHRMAPEAMRRMADLQIEKEYGVIGDGSVIELPAPPESGLDPGTSPESRSSSANASAGAPPRESDEAFEERTTRRDALMAPAELADHHLPDGGTVAIDGPAGAIETYKKILAEYPDYERNDQVLYQMARAYDELAQPEEAMAVMDRLIARYPDSKFMDEVYFRRAEYFFVRKKYLDAEESYQSVVAMGDRSAFYELALYKLGWSLYKQELYEAALHQYMALLDYKLSTGYDFDRETEEEDEERRVADTFRVVSLSFSNLGDPDVLSEYFSTYGNRSYEDRIYKNLAEFHLSKRRYHDAASVYKSFVELYPFHRISPHFSMRISEVYAEGDFPLLVVESKRDFAKRYGLQSEYWHHFDVADSQDVVDYLKTNLKDLANHYHALYQDEALEDDSATNFAEARQWYREFLTSFPDDVESPPINYQLADLLLEHGDFGQSAQEYERTAYEYPPHEQSSAAGYAAIYAHRENLKVVDGAELTDARRATVDSSLKFADTFPDHEHAAPVLGAAAEDLYDMQDFELAIASAHKLIDRYPDADVGLRRSAWTIVAHSSFDLALYPEAEQGYSQVLALTDAEDENRQALVDNLAASIYKQGEQARLVEDYASAADHFLRIKSVAPTSEIRAAAEYDAAAALIHLENWTTAADVLEDFRSAYPDHELEGEATRQLASVYQKAGDLSRSAQEYERVAAEADDPEMRREALLVAGELYEDAQDSEQALRVYEGYVEEFPRPLDDAVETRFKVAEMYRSRGDLPSYHDALRAIVAIDGSAGPERTDRSRFLAAKSALVLTELDYRHFADLNLVQPFKQSLAEKQRRMDDTLRAFEALVDYEVAEVTAAATFYMAEVYGNFSTALLESERPSDLSAAELVDYDLVIEDEAYPFEERSIEVHQKNLELMSTGVFNAWIERSLDRLAELMPGRYAKYEISSGFVGSIDFYAYQSPRAATEEVPMENVDDEVSQGEATPTPEVEIAPEPVVEAVPEPVVEPAEPRPNDLAGVNDVTL